MSLVLAIDTSTSHCSVALAREGSVIAYSELSIGMSHSSHLTKLIDQLLVNTSISYEELDAVALSVGPGSYTGLRIGASVAKGLCYAHDKKLVGVSTLDVLAFQVSAFVDQDTLLVPMLDARRMEVYSKVLKKDMSVIEVVQPVILDEGSYASFLNRNKVVFIGDGAIKFSEICKHENAVFHGGLFPNAKEVALLGVVKLAKEEVEDVAYFEPFYLKEFYTGAK